MIVPSWDNLHASPALFSRQLARFRFHFINQRHVGATVSPWGVFLRSHFSPLVAIR
jgi:hypothetical protein